MEKKNFISNTNEKLSKVLSKNLLLYNVNRAKKLIDNKDVLVNSARVHNDIVVSKGDIITVFYNPIKILSEEFYKLIYADDNVVVVNKRAGIETVNDNANSLVDILKEKYPTIIPIHRLDRETTGIVIFALNRQSEEELLSAFKSRTVTKIYTALCANKMPKQSDKLISYLVKDAKNSFVKIFDTPVANSVKIETDYKVLDYKNGLSRVEIVLHSGKTHQIRAHMAHIGRSILGDSKYGKESTDGKLMLHSTQLQFNFSENDFLFYINEKKFVSQPDF